MIMDKRTAEVSRKTGETDISMNFCIDGSGKAEIACYGFADGASTAVCSAKSTAFDSTLISCMRSVSPFVSGSHFLPTIVAQERPCINRRNR